MNRAPTSLAAGMRSRRPQVSAKRPPRPALREAGNPHLRFDERGRETGTIRLRRPEHPRPSSTLPTWRSEVRERPAIIALRLLAVLNVGFKNVGARHAVPEVCGAACALY